MKAIDKEYAKKNIISAIKEFKTSVVDTGYVKKENGKVLSTCDFTPEYEAIVQGLIDGTISGGGSSSGGTSGGSSDSGNTGGGNTSGGSSTTVTIPTTAPTYNTTTYPSKIVLKAGNDVYYIATNLAIGSNIYYNTSYAHTSLSSTSDLRILVYKLDTTDSTWKFYMQNDADATTNYVSFGKGMNNLTLHETNLNLIDDRSLTEATSSTNPLDMTATQVAADMGVGYNVGCMFESYEQKPLETETAVYKLPTAYPLNTQYYNTANPADDYVCYETFWGSPPLYYPLFKAIKDKGFKTIRLPVTWGMHTNSYGKIDSRWMERVKQAVQIILSLDMYCIVNMHHDSNKGWLTADDSTYASVAPVFKGLWYQIATELKDFGGKLIFESFNEITDTAKTWDLAIPFNSTTTTDDKLDSDACNQLNQDFVTVVRQCGGNNNKRHLICSVFGCNTAETNMYNYVVPTDIIANHIMAQVHCYDVYETKLPKAYSYLSAKNVPFVLGEFGAKAVTPRATRETVYKEVVAYCKQKGIVPIYWDDGSAPYTNESNAYNYCILNRHTLDWVFPELSTALVNTWNTTTSSTEVDLSVDTSNNLIAKYEDIQDVPMVFDSLDINSNTYKSAFMLQSNSNVTSDAAKGTFLVLSTSTSFNYAETNGVYTYTYDSGSSFVVYKTTDGYTWTSIPQETFASANLSTSNYAVLYNGTTLGFDYPSLLTVENTRVGDAVTYLKAYLSCDTLEHITYGDKNGYVTVNSTEPVSFVVLVKNGNTWSEYCRYSDLTTCETPLVSAYVNFIAQKDKYLSYNQSPTYYTLSDMKSDTNLVVGDIVTTGGYYEFNDGGAGVYEIASTNYKYPTKSGYTTTDSNTSNNTFDSIALSNGLYAHLRADKMSRFPMILGGVKPNNGTTAIHRCIQCMTYRMNRLGLEAMPTYLKEGNYYLTGVTPVFGINLVGHKDKATIIIDAEHYTDSGNVDYMFKTPQASDRNIDGNESNAINITKFYIDGVNFVENISTSSYQVTKAESQTTKVYETYMVCAEAVTDIRITNSKFIVQKATTNGAYQPTTAFQVRDVCSNVYVDNCTFSNFTCDTNDMYPQVNSGTENDASSSGHREFTAGGAFWFIKPKITNATIQNSTFNGTCSDEVLSLFGTSNGTHYITNALIKSCSLNASKHQNDEFIAINYLNDSTITINDCTLSTTVATANTIKCVQNNNCTVKILNSNFNYNSSCRNIWSYNSSNTVGMNNAMLLFKNNLDYSTNTDYYLTTAFANNTYLVDNCKFTSASSSNHRYFVNSENCEVTVKNCTVTGGLETDCGLGAFDAKGCKINYIDNTFYSNSSNKIIKVNKGCRRPQIFNFTGNTFSDSMYKVIIGVTGTEGSEGALGCNFQFNFTNNNIDIKTWVDANTTMVQAANTPLFAETNNDITYPCKFIINGTTFDRNMYTNWTSSGVVRTFFESLFESNDTEYIDLSPVDSTVGDGLTQVEYAGCPTDTSQTAYFITDYIPNTYTDLSCRFRAGSLSAKFIYGAKTSDTNQFALYGGYQDFTTRFGDSAAIKHTLSGGDINKYIVDVRHNKNGVFFKENGVEYNFSNTFNAFTSEYPLAVFSSNVQGEVNTSNLFRGKIYNLTVREKGVYKMYLVPVKNNTTGRYGFYDLVGRKSYFSEGTNSFYYVAS